MRTLTRTAWFLPLFSLALGVTFLVAFWIGGKPRDGVYALLVMAGFGLVALLGGRSEMIRGLRGDGRDEYWDRMDTRATALAGIVVIAAVIVMCVWEWGHGRDGTPYVQLGAIGGVAYVAALAWLRLRS